MMFDCDSVIFWYDFDLCLGDLFENLLVFLGQVLIFDISVFVLGMCWVVREVVVGDGGVMLCLVVDLSVLLFVFVCVLVDDVDVVLVGQLLLILVCFLVDVVDILIWVNLCVEWVFVEVELVFGGGLDDFFVLQDEYVDVYLKKKCCKGCLIVLIIVFVIVGGFVVGGVWVWNMYGDRVSEVFGWGELKDWELGQVNGEVLVMIKLGDMGQLVFIVFYEVGVMKIEDVVYDYIVNEGFVVMFYLGVY